MSLFKRKDSPYWWLKISINGQRLQKSTGTTDKLKAQEYHDKLKAQLWDETRLGIKPTYSWNEAVVRWLKETSHKSTHKEDITKLRWLDKYLEGKNLSDINRDLLDKIIDAKLKDGVSNTTVNRYIEVVRAILRKAAFEWEWLDKPPMVRMLPKPKRRIRWLKHEEAQCLINELPSHLKALVRFSLSTGLRQRNVTYLEWSQVDIRRRTAWIHPDQAKAKKAIPVPLSENAMKVLNEQLGINDKYVFTYKGKPVHQPNNWAWRKALKRAGIEDFRWHDLRHTWASWHVQAGTSIAALQELGGWSSTEMVRNYSHLSSEHLTCYADKMSESLTVTI
jgi:integrase